ncbi:MAG TPA: ribbon-helix-helix protein, CopG family [Candidatus Sumerlaeota bacterium]|nr:MAG: hypothetical protein BWZ08_00705 [candidate division BRC1 bacterium ADurb.BinA292]HOE97261.1 ribbon-helix-helix protein, CopG family [Candidatus Sumerlaeota bacterium]HOR29335.1 ribbon-helix-helix protein, CopG family [Candidatus Sumerlaeota bacterium]
MVRTQIYLTKHQREALAALAKAFGANQRELIREAIDRLIEQKSQTHRKATLKEATGMVSPAASWPPPCSLKERS